MHHYSVSDLAQRLNLKHLCRAVAENPSMCVYHCMLLLLSSRPLWPYVKLSHLSLQQKDCCCSCPENIRFLATFRASLIFAMDSIMANTLVELLVTVDMAVVGLLSDVADLLCSKDWRLISRHRTHKETFPWFTNHGSWCLTRRVWLAGFISLCLFLN